MILLWILGGLVVGIAYVVIAGILEVQISGALAGGVYDLNNVVVAVTEPHIPFLQYASLAVLSALILMLGSRVRGAADNLPHRIALVGGFAVSTLVLIAWGFVLQGAAMAEAGGVRQGLPEGFTGWILKGGTSVVAHAVAVVAAATVISIVLRVRTAPAVGSADTAVVRDEAREGSV